MLVVDGDDAQSIASLLVFKGIEAEILKTEELDVMSEKLTLGSLSLESLALETFKIALKKMILRIIRFGIRSFTESQDSP